MEMCLYAKSKGINRMKSNCCFAEIKFIGGDDGTNHYECAICGDACDPFVKPMQAPAKPMQITKAQVQKAARFSNFAQKLKTLIWAKMAKKGTNWLSESDYDDIALEMFEWLNKK